MTEDHKKRPEEHSEFALVRSLLRQGGLAAELYAHAGASQWGLTQEGFLEALERGAGKRFAAEEITPQKLEEYLGVLHVEDLALACACLEDSEAAWEHFVAVYRGYLRSAAGAVLRCSAGDAEACELADSLFAELYGLTGGKRGKRSLFRYFHGRSSLKTWLRAVLAQRHVDMIRARRRFETLEGNDEQSSHRVIRPESKTISQDPHRQRYLELFSDAFRATLAQLDPRDKQRLFLYYAEEQTLAAIGKHLGEHESSVSRNLERVRRELRSTVELRLRAGGAAANGSAARAGLSDAEIALCFEYAAEDAPLDLQKVFRQPGARDASARNQEP